ncbi:MAG: carboxypeptidase regulatory-like domain-containing protein [Chitinophagaceae bacterium]
MRMQNLTCLLLLFLITTHLHAQETNSQVSGKIISNKNESLAGATVTAIHQPTKNIFTALSSRDGYFHLFNLKPGGPYTFTVSYTGFETIRKDDVFFNLSNNDAVNFILQEKNITLAAVSVTASVNTKTGIETEINNQKLLTLPSISRSLQDFIRVVPQAKVTGEGVISLAGQNNRFNAFFIDGANNNDILGLAVNGTTGGLTGAPPVSIEALEQIKVLLAPYDVQYGTFTGGSINAITKSGSNETKASAWYNFRNENLAGRAPQPLEKPGLPGEFYRPRLSSFFNQTFGIWNSGPLIKNKLFYFALIEKQAETKPQPFNISEYRGNSNQQQLFALSDSLQMKYGYDPGSFLETKDELNATRMILKFDWNASTKDKFMLSYRYNDAERTTPRVQSSSRSIIFQNNGITIPARTHSASFEWKHFFKRRMNNRFLLTFTNLMEDRQWIGQPFPNVEVQDGNGTIVFGSDAVSGAQGFKANDITLFNAFKLIKKNHVVTIGADVNYTKLNHTSIPNFFGFYQYRNLNDFISGSFPSRFQRSLPLGADSIITDNYVTSKFSTLRSSAFINDELKIGPNLKLNMGLRLDMNSIFSKRKEDKFFNDTAVKIITKYYDLHGATSGKVMEPNLALSPRFGISYKLPKYDLTLRGGAGIFVGRSINVWASNVVGSNTSESIDINPQQYGLYFNADPFKQPSPRSLNVEAKGNLNLMAKNFKYPSVFRTSFTAEKKIKSNWTFSIEGILTKNINETVFKNVNILPPVLRSALPDSRNIYSLNSAPDKIPLKSNGSNPYGNIFLITNNKKKKGSAYSLSFIIDKQVNTFSFNSSYTYGKSKLLFEITGPQTPIIAQWRNLETVNGRNFTSLSTSDNDMQHRMTAWVSKKIIYSKSKAATSISMFYNGQSGNPYSYVYDGSIVNDNGNREIFDLIYVPTLNELSLMNFVAIRNTNGPVTFSTQQQKDLLNEFIESDKYLKKHRGEFAKRNGARLPFTHIIDVRLQQDVVIKIKSKKVGLTITYDVFNFTNMLNKDWGRIYFLSNDAYPLIRFAGYANTTTLTPQYQYTPVKGKPYKLQTSTAPGNSARWLSQIGIKLNLN